MQSAAKSSEICLFFFSLFFVCSVREMRLIPSSAFSAPSQIPAVFMDSPDLITVNEPAKTFRSK